MQTRGKTWGDVKKSVVLVIRNFQEKTLNFCLMKSVRRLEMFV